MNSSTRRNFLKSASILSISVLASRHVFAAIPGQSVLLGSSVSPLDDVGPVTQWLRQLLGVNVDSTRDANGLWALIIDGVIIPLTFSLPDAQVTATGKVISSIDGSEIYGNSGWAPSSIQGLFAAGGANLGGMPNTMYVPNATVNKVGQGQDGTPLYDALDLMASAMGMAVTQATISADALQIENAFSFVKVERIFGLLGITGNLLELTDDEATAAEMWEDAGQAAIGIALLFPVSAPFAIGGAIILTAWELWEYKRAQ